MRALAALALALVALALAGGTAQAHVVFAHGRAYGVTPTPKARKAQALSRLGSQAASLTVGGPQPLLKYHNGPLMLSSKLYLIFWEQKAGEFSSQYTEPIIQYAKDLQAEDAHTTDEFSVADQYTDKEGKPITGKVEFGGDVIVSASYPPLEEGEGCTKAPCVTDTQIRAEIVKQIEANHWPTDSASTPEAQYLLYTPKGVANCEFGECSPEAFCAYHSEITGIGAEKKQVAVYSDLPYVTECDSEQAPPGVEGNKDTDGTLDSEIHEIVESATDPAPETGYTDQNREEVADKCTYPTVSEQAEVYGAPLGGSLTDDTAFNQLIKGHSYYTQQIWSNASTITPSPGKAGEAAGCAARIGPSPSFTAPTEGTTGHAIAFDGSASYDISAKITTYEWNFGDGSPVDSSSGANPRHYFLQPGTYQVSLTVIDGNGKADASTQTLPIKITGAAVGLPTARIEEPVNNQTYVVGESVSTKFSCADAGGGPGVESCTDSNGGASPSGKLDTSTVGPHGYTVTAVSSDGQRGTATIDYTVTSPSGNPGGGNPGGSGTPGSGAAETGSSGGGAGLTFSTATSSSSGATSGVGSSGAGGHPKPLTNAQKFGRAIKACGKLKKSKRASCIATARRRFGPKKGKRKAKSASEQRSLGFGVEEDLRLAVAGGPLAPW